DEYYFDSRAEGFQKTDEEHYSALCELVGDRRIRAVAVDPSAASFIEVIRRHGVFQVVPAQNNVVNGIRRVSQALKSGRIRICDTCKAARREFCSTAGTANATLTRPSSRTTMRWTTYVTS
nr:hypothetical protein [Ruminococcus sp.]